MEELNRELYHSLKFSNEDGSNSSNQVDKPVRVPRIRSFTFDVGHQKLEFSRSDEAMISMIQNMISVRMFENRQRK